MGQGLLQPDGTAVAGPYLAGNPALKFAGTGQQRLNTSTAIQNYNGLQLTAPDRARNPAVKFEGPRQERLNTSAAIQDYNRLELVASERLTRGLGFRMNYT